MVLFHVTYLRMLYFHEHFITYPPKSLDRNTEIKIATFDQQVELLEYFFVFPAVSVSEWTFGSAPRHSGSMDETPAQHA